MEYRMKVSILSARVGNFPFLLEKTSEGIEWWGSSAGHSLALSPAPTFNCVMLTLLKFSIPQFPLLDNRTTLELITHSYNIGFLFIPNDRNVQLCDYVQWLLNVYIFTISKTYGKILIRETMFFWNTANRIKLKLSFEFVSRNCKNLTLKPIIKVIIFSRV